MNNSSEKINNLVLEAKHLLEKTDLIVSKYKEIEKLTGSNFDFFSICNIETREVLICRVISALLDPKGKHGQGGTFLKLFFELVLKMEYKNENIENTRITTEYLIDSQRRIDIMIENDDYSTPIEAKIYAGDQEDQCSDYLEYTKNSKLFYLTLDGHEPTEESVSDFDKRQNIKAISFKEEIITWLEISLKVTTIIQLNSVREVIFQTLINLRRLCGMDTNLQNKEIGKLIKTEADFESFICLENAMPDIRKDIYENFIQDIIKELNYQKIFESHWEDYTNKLKDDVFRKSSGADYLKLYKIDKTIFNEQLYYCIGVGANDYFYVGIYNKNENNELSNEFFEKYFNNGNEYKNSPKWPCYKYLKIDGERLRFDENCIAISYLLNNDKRKKFIKNVAEELKKIKEKVET